MQNDNDRILICLSPAPSNRMIIEAAVGMCRSSRTDMTALFIETSAYSQLSPQDKARLQENMALARDAGAQVEVVSGEDIPFQIAEYARRTGIRRIVIGQSVFSGHRLFRRPDFSEELLRYLPDAELHIIPDGHRKARYRPQLSQPVRQSAVGLDILVSLFTLSAATLLGALFYRLGFSSSNIMMTYLLGVTLIAAGTSHRGYSLASAAAAVLLFNYFFVQPRFSLRVLESGYPVTFGVMFLTSFITGTLAVRLKATAHQAAQTAYRTRIISDTDQMLAKARTREEILEVCTHQLRELLEQPFELLDASIPVESIHGETEVLPLQVQSRTYARVRIDVHEKPLEISEHGILLSILGECAFALENERYAREKEEAAVQIENERLRSTLLRSISHDLRTPLTSISGIASSLLSHEDSFDADTRHGLYETIYTDSLWLTNMVENLLASTRLENNEAHLHFSDEVLEDIIEEAVSHVRSFSPSRDITVLSPSELLLVHVDAGLILQLLVNLLNNAVEHTPSGSAIRVSSVKEGDHVLVSVADDGPGVPDEDKERIFDMFYTGSDPVSDGRRSLGFGLALCRTIVRAHGGDIHVSDNSPHGSVFSFTLPAEEVSLNE